MWGNDVVDLMVGVPIFIWNNEDQNLCYHSPYNLRPLLTYGSGCLFYLVGYASKQGRENIFQPLVILI